MPGSRFERYKAAQIDRETVFDGRLHVQDLNFASIHSPILQFGEKHFGTEAKVVHNILRVQRFLDVRGSFDRCAVARGRGCCSLSVHCHCSGEYRTEPNGGSNHHGATCYVRTYSSTVLWSLLLPNYKAFPPLSSSVGLCMCTVRYGTGTVWCMVSFNVHSLPRCRSLDRAPQNGY